MNDKSTFDDVSAWCDSEFICFSVKYLSLLQSYYKFEPYSLHAYILEMFWII
jgi:hypothetical protein